jgi:signal transduction histidine kinase
MPLVIDKNTLPALIVSPEPADSHARPFPEEAKAARTRLTLRSASSAWECVARHLDQAANRFIPASCADDPEAGRRARLICRFGHLGAIFGATYALFYLGISHTWGALVVTLGSMGFALAPWLMKRTGSLDIAGNLLSLILVLGFSALCFLEGGMQGHAIAWLASVPLCSLLLLGRRGAGRWMVASFGACAIIAASSFMGISMPPRYDPKWEVLVSAAGYLGFILFMFILGVIFETGRKRAFGKMQEALGALEKSNEQLVRLNAEKSEFLGIAAHDLKNPLGVVIGTAEFLRLCKDESKTDRLADNIINAGKRMLDLVKNLLDANAIEEGRFTSNLERCDLHALVRECLQNNLMTAANKEIKLQGETDGACWVRADRNATLQILDNLISNAVKYSQRKTTVHIRLEVEGEMGTVAIRDEGPGISEEDLKKMFGKFVRLSARPTGGESSNGLGLSIVKRLAEAMAGTVRCESLLGQGATFILRLPAAKK